MLADGILKITRKQLYDEIWQLSVSGVAKKYDLVYSRLMKACKEYDIPYPSSTYWARLEFGKTGPEDIIPLPGDGSVEIQLITREQQLKIKQEKQEIRVQAAAEAARKEAPINSGKLSFEEVLERYKDRLLFLDKDEKESLIKTAMALKVTESEKIPEQLVKYKQEVAAYKKEVKELQRRSYYNPAYHKPEYTPPFVADVSDEGITRIIAILKTIYRAVTEHGGTINEDLSVNIRNLDIRISFVEGKKVIPHVLTPKEEYEKAEYERKVNMGKSYITKPEFRKNDYPYNGKLRIKFQGWGYAKDTDKIKLEDCIGEIFLGLYEKGEEIRVKKEKWEEEQRLIREEREKRIQKRRDERARAFGELSKTQQLICEAADYRHAMEIRAYIAAIAATESDDDTLEWIEWARKKADWLDPMVGRIDDILGKRNHNEAYNVDELEAVKKRLEDELPSYWY